MKKLLLIFLCGLIAGNVFAQDEAGKLKNEGNAAWKAKNYQEAFTKFEQYLKLMDYKDDAYLYNTAVCANKIKNYVAAETYFDKAIQAKYKLADSYLGKALAQQKQNKVTEMLATLEVGIKATPGKCAKLEKMYAVHFLKEGQNFQKANNLTKAAENYMKIAQMTNKNWKVNGFLSLGKLYFNNGASIYDKALPYATTEKAKFEAEKEKALSNYKKAQEYLTQALGQAPDNAEVKEEMKLLTTAIEALTK